MARLGVSAHRESRPQERKRLAALERRRKALAAELAAVDANIRKLKPRGVKARRQMTVEEMDGLLDQLSEGLDHLPTLPGDFSRADIYDDHD